MINLKEAFRYQNFLSEVIREAQWSVQSLSHRYKVTKTHLRNKVNPDALDETEEVIADDFYPNDTVIGLLEVLIYERLTLSEAIGKAKASVDFDIDAAIETNKSRQAVAKSIKEMLKAKPTTKIERGQDYKFNVEGNQVAYYYDVEVKTEENFDRTTANATMRKFIKESDEVSAKIDAAFVNTEVDFLPLFDVNDSYDDVVNQYIESVSEATESAE